MDEVDLEFRNLTYRMFVELGRAPTLEEVSKAGAADVETVRRSWQRLHGEHALVLHPNRSEIRMANPFSAVPTAHRVWAADRWWYANCGWDALGVCAALQADGRIESSCPDCGEQLVIVVRDQGGPSLSSNSPRSHMRGGLTASTRRGSHTAEPRIRTSSAVSASPASSGDCSNAIGATRFIADQSGWIWHRPGVQGRDHRSVRSALWTF